MTMPPFVQQLMELLAGVFIPVGSQFSLTSLLCAAVIAGLVIARRRTARGRVVVPRALLRMIFPRKMFRAATCGADLWFFLLNAFAFGLIFGAAILSFRWVSLGVTDLLGATLGVMAPTTLPGWATAGLATLVLFMAYEFGYWVDHWLSHKVPLLWEFHKVHHTAEILTPLTVWRVHPVEMLKFANILALVTGTASGVLCWLFGQKVNAVVVDGANVLLVIFIHLYLHLQHSQVWIAFTGPVGRVFMSPAHHQIHHSMDPAHFNSNLGSCLSLFDTLFGTLHAPSAAPQKLRFGVEGEGREAHQPQGFLIKPFVAALGGAQAAAPTPPVEAKP